MKKLESILLIDDDSVTNFYNKLLIERLGLGIEVSICLNGEDGINFLTSTGKYADQNEYPSPNLIFLDINMPVADGWEFMEQYRLLPEEQKAEVVVIMLTSSLNPDDRKKAEGYKDVSRFASKPLSMELLEELIGEYWPEFKKKPV